MQNYSPSFVNYRSVYVVGCEHYARRWKNFKNSMNKFVKQKLEVLAAAMVERRKVCLREADVCGRRVTLRVKRRVTFLNFPIDANKVLKFHMIQVLSVNSNTITLL